MEFQGKNLKDMTITELKAFCYDLIVQQEYNLKQIQMVNQMIAQKNNSKPIPEVKEQVVEL